MIRAEVPMEFVLTARRVPGAVTRLAWDPALPAEVVATFAEAGGGTPTPWCLSREGLQFGQPLLGDVGITWMGDSVYIHLHVDGKDVVMALWAAPVEEFLRQTRKAVPLGNTSALFLKRLDADIEALLRWTP